MMRLSVWTVPCLSASLRFSSEMRLRRLARVAARLAASLLSAICRAVRSSDATRKESPADGTEDIPRIWTGREGSASSTAAPVSSNMALTRP